MTEEMERWGSCPESLSWEVKHFLKGPGLLVVPPWGFEGPHPISQLIPVVSPEEVETGGTLKR